MDYNTSKNFDLNVDAMNFVDTVRGDAAPTHCHPVIRVFSPADDSSPLAGRRNAQKNFRGGRRNAQTLKSLRRAFLMKNNDANNNALGHIMNHEKMKKVTTSSIMLSILRHKQRKQDTHAGIRNHHLHPESATLSKESRKHPAYFSYNKPSGTSQPSGTSGNNNSSGNEYPPQQHSGTEKNLSGNLPGNPPLHCLTGLVGCICSFVTGVVLAPSM